MNELDLNKTVIDIQDYLVPILDTYEQAIYHYIFRHTILENKKECVYSTRSAEIGYGAGSKNSPPSMNTRSVKLRSLEEKGAINIINRSHKGITVKINLPHQITGLVKSNVTKATNIEDLDFYKDKALLTSIFKRENYKCFYFDKIIDENSAYLDHVIPQSEGGGNSYRNIVASCFDANSIKNNKAADEFLREVYQMGLIDLNQLQTVKAKIKQLKACHIKPIIN